MTIIVGDRKDATVVVDLGVWSWRDQTCGRFPIVSDVIWCKLYVTGLQHFKTMFMPLRRGWNMVIGLCHTLFELWICLIRAPSEFWPAAVTGSQDPRKLSSKHIHSSFARRPSGPGQNHRCLHHYFRKWGIPLNIFKWWITKNGWLIMEQAIKMDENWGYRHHLGNLQFFAIARI